MTTTDSGHRRGVALAIATTIAVFAEGLRLAAYHDPVGILTVCYGQTVGVEAVKVYSLDECRSRLQSDMLAAIDTVERCAPGLQPNQLAAFGDAVYNLGETIVCDPVRSLAARYLLAGRIDDACNELPRWNKAFIAGVLVPLPGLSKRRRLERSLCLDLIG